jgi:biotin operon repressor
MSQINKIANVLSLTRTAPGMTVAMIAKKTGVPKASVAKRIFDLRSEGFAIETNYRQINGSRKTYYQMSS